ncbi:cytochrome-c oxidase [Ectobacillus antri]|jgi:cbb3-type cytochrome oxidase subunit 1|uniref:Cytochrome-c oxidase n=1 Tax=Ectobacillus antri TaxID=2486280 RepID=A0ABT6H8H7_9BACI|nr:cytochrome-c oxidase [Ectobacillus antri]MDG4658022.1 cytochrome-c oxidase [Ectobacillus antri]MDG5755088.1 cytochrome-c oxidase [Ectobacillus antri]
MGVRFIKISTIYLVVGVVLGMYMSITHSYILTPVHVHINLLGWAAMAVAGILYHLFPDAAASRLGKIHFWLHNIALPIMMLALSFVVKGKEAAGPFVAIGGTALTLAIIIFMVNVFLHVKLRED